MTEKQINREGWAAGYTACLMTVPIGLGLAWLFSMPYSGSVVGAVAGGFIAAWLNVFRPHKGEE